MTLTGNLVMAVGKLMQEISSFPPLLYLPYSLFSIPPFSPLCLPLFHVSIKKRLRWNSWGGGWMASWLCCCCELIFPRGTLFIQNTFTGTNAGERCLLRKHRICLWSRLPSEIQFSINQERMMGNMRMSMCIVPSASFTRIRLRIKVIASFFKMLKYARE